MKRILFILLILAVIAIVAGFGYLEFTAPEISFVTDKHDVSDRRSEIVIRRLYSSGVNADAFAELLDSRQKSDIEFTEDDIFQAALAAGKPRFFPAFHMKVDRVKGFDGFEWTGGVRPEFTDGLDSNEYLMKNLTAEITLEGGVFFDDYSVQYPENYTAGKPKMTATIMAEDRQGLLLDLEGAYGYKLKIAGLSGTVTILYSYDIDTNSLFRKTMLTEQALQVQSNVKVDPNTGITVTYAPQPYSSIEEIQEAES
ncbi:hypothetical protein FACS1894120_6090 [Clostridia bacterium]|nr:hypothetical protein FACS1894120_6090 [Clostridia bacterium]